jgi:hypothetical protein
MGDKARKKVTICRYEKWGNFQCKMQIAKFKIIGASIIYLHFSLCTFHFSLEFRIFSKHPMNRKERNSPCQFLQG